MAGNPATPAAAIGGTITVTGGAGAPFNLRALIQAQLEANCPGMARRVNIQADQSNSASVFIGYYSDIAGDVSATNFAYELTQLGSNTYDASFPGANAPVERIRVFCIGTQTLHVEVLA